MHDAHFCFFLSLRGDHAVIETRAMNLEELFELLSRRQTEQPRKRPWRASNPAHPQ